MWRLNYADSQRRQDGTMILLSLNHKLHSFYNTPCYNTALDITWSCCGSQIFSSWNLQRNYRKRTIGILHRNYRKMTIRILHRNYRKMTIGILHRNYRKMTIGILQRNYRKMTIGILQRNYRKMTIRILHKNYRKMTMEFYTGIIEK